MTATSAIVAQAVLIEINGKTRQITTGPHSVLELKRIGQVPECDELAQILSGEIRPLTDDANVIIQGGETFLSSPRSCPSASEGEHAGH